MVEPRTNPSEKYARSSNWIMKPQISGLKQKFIETTTQMVFSLILLVQKSCCFQKPPLHKTRRFAVHGNPASPYLPRQIARKETENNNCWVSYLWEVICHITILLKESIPLKIVDYQSLQRKKGGVGDRKKWTFK